MEGLKIQETRLALANLDEIASYYEHQQLGLGYRFATYYYKQINILRSIPHIGRSGKVIGTKELVLHEFPYLVVYRVRSDFVQILRIFHQHRKSLS